MSASDNVKGRVESAAANLERILKKIEPFVRKPKETRIPSRQDWSTPGRSAVRQMQSRSKQQKSPSG